MKYVLSIWPCELIHQVIFFISTLFLIKHDAYLLQNLKIPHPLSKKRLNIFRFGIESSNFSNRILKQIFFCIVCLFPVFHYNKTCCTHVAVICKMSSVKTPMLYLMPPPTTQGDNYSYVRPNNLMPSKTVSVCRGKESRISPL